MAGEGSAQGRAASGADSGTSDEGAAAGSTPGRHIRRRTSLQEDTTGIEQRPAKQTPKAKAADSPAARASGGGSGSRGSGPLPKDQQRLASAAVAAMSPGSSNGKKAAQKQQQSSSGKSGSGQQRSTGGKLPPGGRQEAAAAAAARPAPLAMAAPKPATGTPAIAPKAAAAAGTAAAGTAVGSGKPAPQLAAAAAAVAAAAVPAADAAISRPAKRLRATLVTNVVAAVKATDDSDESEFESSGSSSSSESESEDYSDAAGSGREADEPADPAARTAAEVGLNAHGLSEEEAGLLPAGASEADYVRVRNAVLCRWRADVSRVLTAEAALAAVAEEDRPYALAAHRFLSALGYVNFGVAPALHRRIADAPQTAGSVVVIGAGCAGLAAARQLRAAGYKVAVVEGRQRPGGRVWTERLEAQGARAVADIGGSIITGIDGNPLAVLVKQMGLHMADIRSETVPLYFGDGSEPAAELDRAVEQLHNDLLDDCTDMKALYEKTGGDASLGTSLETLWDAHKGGLLAEAGGGDPQAAAKARKLFDWHIANLEFANSCRLGSLSLRHWDQDDPNEMLGAHTFLPGCNGRWVQELCRELPIFYGSPVREVRHCATGVEVQTDSHCLRADAAVVTVPLGVLKAADGLRFSPPLPARKRGAIKRIGFGSMNKVILLFPHAFWDDDLDMFGRVADVPEERGETFLFYSYAHISGGALLIGLCAGEAAEALEQRSAAEAAQRVMRLLRGIFEPRGVEVPAPLQVMTTRWGADPFARGSYSSMSVGTHGGSDYDCLAESLGGRVFFAGEATTKLFPATMHGAFHSGLVVAANVDATLRRLRSLGVAGTAADLAAADEQAAAEQHAAAAAAAELAASAEGDALEVSAEEAAEGAAAVDRQLQLAWELRQLFSSGEPELEAGCLAAALVQPNGSNGSSGHAEGGSGSNGSMARRSLAVLRVDVGAAAAKSSVARRAAGQRFVAASSAAAEALEDAPSREAQLALLQSLPEWTAAGQQVAELGALAAAARRQRAGGGHTAGGGGEQRAAAGATVASDGKQGQGRVFLIPQRDRLRQ